MTKIPIVVVGMDPFNETKLNSLPNVSQYSFISVLPMSEIWEMPWLSLEELILLTRQRIDKFFIGKKPNFAVVGFWDFPVSCIVPYISANYNLLGPSIDSAVKCEHKYWSRCLQREVLSDVPRFCSVDPFDQNAWDKIKLNTPFWLKPIKSYGSRLAFRITSKNGFEESRALIRERISEIAESFNWYLSHVSLPKSIAKVDAYHCIAEEEVAGELCTVEGHVHAGKVKVHGIIDSIRYPKSSAFSRYQYPSKLPQGVKDKMSSNSKTILNHIGYDNAPFNIEYFYDKHSEKVWLLEINTRISQSHADIFEKVDGVSNHQYMLDVALGNEPHVIPGRGRYSIAAKCFLRRFKNGVIQRAPSQAEISNIEAMYPDTIIQCSLKKADRLSDLIDQDSYSYILSEMHIGADDENELLHRYQKIVDLMRFEFEGSSEHHYLDAISANIKGLGPAAEAYP